MAPERSSLLKDPPAAEEEVESEEEEEPVVEEVAGDDDESESDDVEEETPKITNPSSSLKPQNPSSSDESPKKSSHLNRTHIVKTSQPPSQPKKSLVKPTPAAAPKTQATGKRPLEAEKAEKEKESKRKKKKDAKDSVPEEGENHNKSPFQRIFSKDDEIVILKGMIDSIKKGIDPTSDLNEFLDSIKKSIHVNTNKDQLSNKIRRMRQKYKNSLKKVKDGEDPTFTKLHDIKCYKLMKEIWSGSEGKSKKSAEARNGNDDLVVSNGKRSRKAASKSGAPKFEDKNSSLYPCLNGSVHFVNDSTLMGVSSLYKEGLALLGDAEAKELDQKWRQLQTVELQNHLKRLDLEREQIFAVLNALEASDS